MRRAQVWRYYCDFCKKSGCSGGHIAKHERGCTANPERVCGMCDLAHKAQQPMDVLIAALGAGDDLGMERLDVQADGCPACKLAAIRQSGLLKKWSDDWYMPEGARDHFGLPPAESAHDELGLPIKPAILAFDFKKESDAWIAMCNEENTQREYGMGYYSG
jgi:hypothetical protein